MILLMHSTIRILKLSAATLSWLAEFDTQNCGLKLCYWLRTPPPANSKVCSLSMATLFQQVLYTQFQNSDRVHRERLLKYRCYSPP